MRVTYDPEVYAAYIYCVDSIPRGGVKQSIHLLEKLLGVHVDLDSEGRILGIEVLQASYLLPAETIDQAERPLGSRTGK